MNKKIKGSFTIEATVIVPMILFMFGGLLHIFFYYHDKNILLSTAHETATLEMECEDLEAYYYARLEGKLLLFTKVECTAIEDGEKIIIQARGSKKKMAARVECAVIKTTPENYIRDIRNIHKIGEGIGK